MVVSLGDLALTELLTATSPLKEKSVTEQLEVIRKQAASIVSQKNSWAARDSLMKSEQESRPVVYRVKMRKRPDGTREIIEVITEGEADGSRN